MYKKCCAFCHCGEGSTLGQGDLCLFECSFDLNTCKKLIQQFKEQQFQQQSTSNGGDNDQNSVLYDNYKSTAECNELVVCRIKKIFEK